jgi:hypothetical protein
MHPRYEMSSHSIWSKYRNAVRPGLTRGPCCQLLVRHLAQSAFHAEVEPSVR